MTRLKQVSLIFILINLFLYLYILRFNTFVPFNSFFYKYASHHYFHDDRIGTGKFKLLRALGQYDAQWYLRIADRGYPLNPTNIFMGDKSVMDGLTYAFFPLYPILLAIINYFVGYIELTAFIVSIILMIANFFSLYFVIRKIYTEDIAYKSVLLLFLFPFSIFFRSYFTEGIFLFFLIWYCYFLIKRDWTKTSLFHGLLLVTRPTGLFLIPLTFIYMLRDLIKKKLPASKLLTSLILISAPFTLWLLFNLTMTGDILYWKNIQSEWYVQHSIFDFLLHNYFLLKNFFILPFHDLHASKVDIMIFFIIGWILILSYDSLKKEFWWTSFLLWFIPILIKDTMSFSRYQIVSFPVFIYLAVVCNRKSFALIASVFYAVLLFVSLYFVNWNWLG